MSAVYDKTGREIMVGDILKVFHFIDRHKRHRFMYKQVWEERTLGAEKTPYLFVRHLDLSESGYHVPLDGSIRRDVEIVQSTGVDSFYDRPRIPVPAA